MKIGIMGGTFDPIHLAHLLIAEQARSELCLDKVVFTPAGQPWMKSNHLITPAEHRLAMVKLAISSNPCFAVSTVEIERSGPTYTVDTLEQLWKELGYSSQLYLLLGWDSLADISQWKAPYRISKMATLVSFPRPGYAKPRIEELESAMPGISEKLVMLDGLYLGISSTQIRQWIVAGRSIRYSVTDEVAAYINSHKLYRESTG